MAEDSEAQVRDEDDAPIPDPDDGELGEPCVDPDDPANT